MPQTARTGALLLFFFGWQAVPRL